MATTRAHLEEVDVGPGPGMMRLELCCPVCTSQCSMTVDADAFIDWAAGRLSMRNAFPELDAGDRLALETGICDDCAKEYLQL